MYKVSKKQEKLYRLATKKLRDVELDREEFSTKVDEANQNIGALRFENNFLVERTKKLEAKLFQVRAQLERTSSAKLNEMLSFQKTTSDKTELAYDFSSRNIAPLVQLCLYHMLIMLIMRTMNLKLKQLVRA